MRMVNDARVWIESPYDEWISMSRGLLSDRLPGRMVVGACVVVDVWTVSGVS